MHAAFALITRTLRRAEYSRLQWYPTRPARCFGHEYTLVRSVFFQDNVTLFNTSALHHVYKRLLQHRHPRAYDLYRIFFACDEVPGAVLRRHFHKQDLLTLLDCGVISGARGRYLSNYKFVPLGDLFIIASPDREYDTDNYVYIGGDSVILWKLLRALCQSGATKALEIGCGTGFLSLWLSRFAESVTATDVSPRALDFTRLNARINDIVNVAAIGSDVFSSVRGQYDLIVSNPPFLFLPRECVRRTYAYGGHFGTEILERILEGLDEHLTRNGAAFIMAVSYITYDGWDPVYELIQRRLSGRMYAVTLVQIDYQPITDYPDFYRSHRISHSVRYLIGVVKGGRSEIRRAPVQGLSRLLGRIAVTMLRAR